MDGCVLWESVQKALRGRLILINLDFCLGKVKAKQVYKTCWISEVRSAA